MLIEIKERFFGKGKLKHLAEKSLFTTLIEPIKKFEVIFDVGAHYGKFTSQFLAHNLSATYYCFEPTLSSFDLLKQNLSGFSNIKLINTAISDYRGKGDLNINCYDETNSLLANADVNPGINELTKKIKTQEVCVDSIDQFCREQGIEKIDFIKIDTQGNSFKVLQGMENLLLKNKIEFLYVEAEFVPIYQGEMLFSEIELYMRKRGYSVVDFFNFNYIDGKLGWCDVLFTNK